MGPLEDLTPSTLMPMNENGNGNGMGRDANEQSLSNTTFALDKRCGCLNRSIRWRAHNMLN
jgi:hypothetical protein